jgi:LPS-assembly lipoprotein
MWWREHSTLRRLSEAAAPRPGSIGIGSIGRPLRVAAALAMAALTAACFQPLYGERTISGGPGVQSAMNSVDVAQIAAPNGSPEARIAVQLRNDLLFGLTGGGAGGPPAYRLNIRMASTQLSVIVDVNTARPDVENYGINATYDLVDLKTGKPVLKDETFARVSYDIPGQEQRFARQRALRDAENRAAQVIADNIKSRLASYFLAGT